MKKSYERKATARTTYSPVRHMNNSNEPKTTNQNKHQHHFGDQVEAEFVDDELGVDEELSNYLDQHQRHNNRFRNYNAPGQQLNKTANNLHRESLAASPLEEVYLCNCCGVTKELDPAMKYMPIFRSLFFLFNFLVFAFGLADLGMGLWFRIDPKVYEIHKYIETQNITIAGWIMLFGGFLACIMSLVGCAAAMRQKVGLLSLYCGWMIILTCLFIGTVVLLTVHGLGIQLEQFLIKEIYEQIRRRTMNTELDLFMNTDSAQFLDFVQVKMRCCGAADFRDYQKLGMVIPTTCYTIAGNYINAPGCGHAIRELLDIRAGLATGFTTMSVVAQLFTIILSSLMICSIYNWRSNPRPAMAVATRSSSATPSPVGAFHHRHDVDRHSTQLKQFHNEQQQTRSPSRTSSSIRV